jgi:5-methylcytosine-specific restriction endonuclease McrA
MPLQHLQVIGGHQVQFLYEYPIANRLLTLKPGVAFNLRRYQPLVQQLARAAWIDHVRRNKRNAPMLGQIDDLESFMFGSSRNILAAVAPVLAVVQSGRCFYCDKAISGTAEVDHFIPWSRYPRDTAHNFVLADRECNNQKRGMLAARPHLERWLEQIDRHGQEIGALLASEGFIVDVNGSRSVTRWAYQQAASASGNAWVRGKLTEPVGSEYLQVLDT